MPTLPTEPVMISAPDQVPAAVDNLLALDYITQRQARTLRLLANRSAPIHVEQRTPRRALHVRVGDDPPFRLLASGIVRYR